MVKDKKLPSSGVLKKWTNYVTGWQDRYFEIKNGTLNYYKSKAEKGIGCRGSVSLKSATITGHDFDECEFTIAVGDMIWYLKSDNLQSKNLWMNSLLQHIADSDVNSNPRKVSVSSQSGRDNGFEDEQICTRIAELEAHRTMCCEQIASIQRILEADSAISKSTIGSLKATHDSMMANINQIIRLVKIGEGILNNSSSSLNREETRLKEIEQYHQRKEMELCHLREERAQPRQPLRDITPSDVTSDCEEWHDANEDSIERGEEACPTPSSENGNAEANDDSTVSRQLPFGHYDSLTIDKSHHYYQLLDGLSNSQLKYALAGVEDNVWSLFAEDGKMKMYTREETEGGLPVDPLKALHRVEGVSALEFVHYFFDARYKMEWDHTVNAVNVVETASPDTVILHQKHKTVWPAASRESLFVSHVRRVDEMRRVGAHDMYIVCNTDVDRPDVKLGSSSSVRVRLKVSMVCETVLAKPYSNSLERQDVACNIIYVSQVHPGGWVPTVALRQVYKSEYPKFLRTFTDYVLKKVKDKPLSI